ncbi:MAG: DNA-3-methyladenine glycosylase [Kiritimatiellae bacterium]|nr:DNA-3-methyladenine glycosylase [Kiritimatiellia bacterium]
MSKLKRTFYIRSNVVQISTDLLGKHLFTHLPGYPVTGGIIVETEAYAGPDDKASHAYGNRRTKRTEVMFHSGGVAYVYLCYGIHSLFNIVTNVEGIPHAVLIRAIQPTHGTAVMLTRRNKKKLDRTLTGGPGTLTQALGINTTHTGMSLSGGEIWIESRSRPVPNRNIEKGPRVGVDYAGSDAARPWRFRIKNNIWTSRA